jgi:hypothetical protein
MLPSAQNEPLLEIISYFNHGIGPTQQETTLTTL